MITRTVEKHFGTHPCTVPYGRYDICGADSKYEIVYRDNGQVTCVKFRCEEHTYTGEVANDSSRSG